MTNSISKLSAVNRGASAKRRHLKPPIPLERAEPKEPVVGEYHTYKLRTNPTKEKSPIYELPVPYFAHGTCKEWLKCKKNILSVIKGQNVNDYDSKLEVARRILKNQALSALNASSAKQMAKQTADENDSDVDRADRYVATIEVDLDAVTAQVFPPKAAQKQKRWMRRYMRKPRDVTNEEFVARVIEVNELIPEFPPGANGLAPEKMPDDELLDNLEFGSPPSWQTEFLLQGYEPTDGTIQEFIDFCRTLEEVEEVGDSKPKESKKDGNSKKRKQSDSSEKGSKSNKKYFCLLHGSDCKHNTDDCKTLKFQAKRMKDTYESQGPNKKAYKDKMELQAMVASAVDEALKSNKKQKRSHKKEAAASEETNTTEILKQFDSLNVSTDSECEA